MAFFLHFRQPPGRRRRSSKSLVRFAGGTPGQAELCNRGRLLEVRDTIDRWNRANGDFQMKLTAVYQQVPEGYIAFVEELPGANTQGDTLDEARENLREAVTLVLEANRELAERSLVGQNVTREPFELDVA
jgi:predicted RNase H-like HicB family nuclease